MSEKRYLLTLGEIETAMIDAWISGSCDKSVPHPREEWLERREYEEIATRCRDCKHYEHKMFRNYDDYEFEHLCWYFSDYEDTPAYVDPDGFCAWGEPRES